MNHPAREEWAPYLFGEANQQAHQRFSEHLRNCPECRAEFEAWRRTRDRLDAWKLVEPRRQLEFLQPMLRYAAAAALVLGIGFGVGRFSSPAPASAAELRAQVEASVKSALTAELRRQWAADLQNALDRTQQQASEATTALEGRLAKVSEADLRQTLNGFVEVLNRAREEDRLALRGVLQDLQKQHNADFLALRRDLETVASMTDEEIRQARLLLTQVAAGTAPNQ